MYKKLLAFILGIFLISGFVYAEPVNRYNTRPIQQTLVNTVESGVVRANIYKTAVTSAAGSIVKLVVVSANLWVVVSMYVFTAS